jgi:hypothetical protein
MLEVHKTDGRSTARATGMVVAPKTEPTLQEAVRSCLTVCGDDHDLYLCAEPRTGSGPSRVCCVTPQSVFGVPGGLILLLIGDEGL